MKLIFLLLVSFTGTVEASLLSMLAAELHACLWVAGAKLIYYDTFYFLFLKICTFFLSSIDL